MRRLPKNIAKNEPQAKAPPRSASADPKSTGTAEAVKEKGRASRNHSAKRDRRGFVAFIGPAATDDPSIRVPRLDLRFQTWSLSSLTTGLIL
jgi:hypothetical protein